MNTLLVLLFCAVVSLAMTALFLAILFVGRRPVNERAHKLGRFLVVSHPEWN